MAWLTFFYWDLSSTESVQKDLFGPFPDLWPIRDTGKVEAEVTVFDDGPGAGFVWSRTGER